MSGQRLTRSQMRLRQIELAEEQQRSGEQQVSSSEEETEDAPQEAEMEPVSEDNSSVDTGVATSVDGQSSSEGEGAAEKRSSSTSGEEEQQPEEEHELEVKSSSSGGDHGKAGDFSPIGESDCDSELEAEEQVQEDPVDLTNITSEDLRRKYTELMESMEECEKNLKTASDERTRAILSENIKKGEVLMRRLEQTMATSLPGSSRGLGNAATNLVLACEHTKKCAIMLKELAKACAGADDSFKNNDFIDALKNMHLDQKGQYSAKASVKTLSTELISASYSVDPCSTLFGLADQIDPKPRTAQDEAGPSPKQRKARPPRKQAKMDDDIATQSEVINDDTSPALEEPDGPEKIATGIVQSLNASYEATGKPQSLLEVAKADTVPEVVGRLFGASFLVRDGRVALAPAPGTDCEAGPSGAVNLTLTPKKPKKKKQEGEGRQQYIASFSAKFLREYMAKSGGKLPGMTDDDPTGN